MLIAISGDEAHTLFIEAARYAFGRATYASGLTARIIERHVDELNPSTCYVLARDVKDELDMFDAAHNGKETYMWYDCDIKPWVDLLPKLEARAAEEEN